MCRRIRRRIQQRQSSPRQSLLSPHFLVSLIVSHIRWWLFSPAQATDLVFLIDGSGSIGAYVFQMEVLRFLNEFVELFDIGPEKTRVAVVQFSDQIRHEFDLNQYTTPQALKDAIHRIQ